MEFLIRLYFYVFLKGAPEVLFPKILYILTLIITGDLWL
jgi:hypothetical protein